MRIIDLIFIGIVYVLIGAYINWKTEPLDRFDVRKYYLTTWIILFVDLFFWPLELIAYFIYRKIIKGWK